MHWQDGWNRFWRLWNSDSAANVDDELRFHFDQKVEEFIAMGMSRDEARKRAEAEFGDVNEVSERLREIDGRIGQRQRRAEWWESIAQDLRYVVRTLGRAPMFTVTVIITLALGLGANAALFSVLDRLYVQTPGGVTDAGKLRRVYQFMPNGGRSFTRAGLSYPEIRELRRVASAGIALAGYRNSRLRLGRNGEGAEVGASFVEGNYFGIAGVRPLLGRFFAADESRIKGISMVAVISHALWMRQFNGDSTVVGREIDIGSHRHVIIGVANQEFRGLDLDVADLWVPLSTDGTLKGRDPAWYENKNYNGTSVVARISDEPGTRLFDARATEALRRVRISKDSMTTTYLASIIEAKGGRSYDKELAISTRLAGVAAIILLIACANVVNLLLARAAHRQREIAIRLALGVSRRRLLSQLMIESGVLATLSSVVALFVAYVGATTLRALLLPKVHWSAPAVNERVALFTVGLALLSGFAAGLVPALQASRPDLSNALKSSVRDGGRRGSRLRSSLLVAQAALSVVLLVGAGVFVRSLRSVESIDTGYDTPRLLYASVGFDRELGDRADDIQLRMAEAVERVRRVPGVEMAATAFNIPMWGIAFTSVFLPGRDSLPPAQGMDRILSVVSPEFFSTVGMRVLRGRGFTSADREGAELVIAINENMARNLWPGEEALNKCIIVGDRDQPCRRVVGIVSHAHFHQVIEEPSMLYYLPLAQAAKNGKPGVAGTIVIRTAPGRTARVGSVVARELTDIFGSWSRPKIQTMEEIVAPEMRPWRMGAALFTAAGLLALLIAAVGVYSSIAYTISQRTQEMGIRVALGASAGNIMQLVVREGVRVVAIGIGIGLIVALALGSVVASLLYETSPRDPFVLIVSTMTLLVVAVAACSIPAWRAARVDPLSAMRAE